LVGFGCELVCQSEANTPHTVFCFTWLSSEGEQSLKVPIYKESQSSQLKHFPFPTEADCTAFASVGLRFCAASSLAVIVKISIIGYAETPPDLIVFAKMPYAR
jgi:hypothetical protein